MIDAPLHLSLVVPVYRGESFLAALVEEIEALDRGLATARAPLRLLEAIFVDDRAVDGSAALLERLKRGRTWLRTIHLAENVGQHLATATGLASSAGDWVATLDEDGQHPPRDVVRLLGRAVERGADLVYAAPLGGVRHGLSRDFASAAAKRLCAAFAGEPRLRAMHSFRLMRGDLARIAGARLAPRGYLDVHLVALAPRLETCALRLEDPRAAAGVASGYDFAGLLRHASRLVRELRAARRGDAPTVRAGLDVGLDRRGDGPLRLHFAAQNRQRASAAEVVSELRYTDPR